MEKLNNPSENLENIVEEGLRFLADNPYLGFRELREFFSETALPLDDRNWQVVKTLIGTRYLQENYGRN